MADGELTALALNNQIVAMRPLVSQSRARCARHMVRRMRAVAKRNAKSDKERSCNERKVDRLAAELDALKHLRPDDVSKFALVNVKTADELINSWSPCTAASVRALQRAAGQPVLAGEVDRFRAKYAAQWHTAVPFLLQRLGLQYRDGSRQKRKGGAGKRLAKTKGAKKQDETAESPEGDRDAETAEAPTPSADEAPVRKERLAQRRAKKRDAAVDELLAHLSAAAPEPDGVRAAGAKMAKKAGGRTKRQKVERPPPPPQESLPEEVELPVAAGSAVIERLRLDGAGAEHRSNDTAVATDGDGRMGGRPASDEEPDAFFAAASGSSDEGEKKALPLPPGQKRGSRGGAGRSKAVTREANKTPLGNRRRRTQTDVATDKQPKRQQQQQQQQQEQQQTSKTKPPVVRAEKKGRPAAVPPSLAAAASDPVHPSWEAKRAAREALKAAKPAGKKIVFGDD